MVKIELDNENSALRPPNHSIRVKRKGKPNFKREPEFLTLMAIGLNEQSRIFWTRTYRTAISNGLDEIEINTIETKLAEFAIAHADRGAPTPQNIELVSRNVNGIDFIGCSYFTVVICWDGWGFVDKPEIGQDQLMFFTEKPGISRKHANSSFFDASPTVVKTYKGNFNAVRCINYLKKEGTEIDLLPGEQSPFGFDIYLTMPLEAKVGALNMPIIEPQSSTDDEPILPERVVIIIDPTGDNKGPKP